MQRYFLIRRHGETRARLLTVAQIDRYFDNRNPRDWTDPVQADPQGWVS